MRARIIVSLILLFVLFTSGSLLALITFGHATDMYGHVVKLHQIEDLRRQLQARVLKVQMDLLAYATPYQVDMTTTVRDALDLDKITATCGSCHHPPAIEANLADLQREVMGYQNGLSFYITASANGNRRNQLKYQAAVIGSTLLEKTEAMSYAASKTLTGVTAGAKDEARQGRILLIVTFALTCLAGVLIAIHLTRFITRPVQAMVGAARAISEGKLGYAIAGSYRAEFGELARAFNAMSLSLKRDQDNLLSEIQVRRETEAALRQSEERYALAERGANDGLWDWDLVRDRIYFSPRWKTMLGHAEQEIGSTPADWFKLVHADDLPKLQGLLAVHMSGDSEQFSSEHRMRHADGTYRWVLVRGVAIRDPSGKAYRMAGSQTDVTDRKLAEQQLQHDAFYDQLTGLPNRALFVNRLEHSFSVAKRSGHHKFAVLFLDLDRFKFVNDSFGHAIGDQLLADVAARLTELLRPGDTVARFGGDEFAVLLSEVDDLSAAKQVAERVLEKLRDSYRIDGHEVFTSASIGIALASSRYDQPDQLLRDADLALYQAKANGKSRFEAFDALMLTRTVEQMHLETDLRGALERGELRVFYQPIYSLEKSEITGFEALLRWQHPVRGLIAPDDFIPIAEECGLIGRIGEWVMREACGKLAKYSNRNESGPDLTMNVNISGRQLTPQLVQEVREILRETGVVPKRLRLEITESIILADAAFTESLLEELRSLGIGIHIDDFGTGYSSLSYLHRFSVDALKIDKSFVGTAGESKENLEIVKAIVALAKILDMEVIAEGVESREQVAMLQGLGCKYVQGFLISRPREMDALDTRCAFALVSEPTVRREGKSDGGLSNAA